MPTAALVSLATSVPPHVFLQKDVLAAAWDVFGRRFPEFERFSSIFSNTGNRQASWCETVRLVISNREGWPERNRGLSGRRRGAVCRRRGVRHWLVPALNGGDIDTAVTVCSTGIATPSLEARVARRMGFRSDVTRCAGVRPSAVRAGPRDCRSPSRLAQARPGTNVLLVTIELCSLAIRLDELTKANIVATSLFRRWCRRGRIAGGRWRRNPDRECRRAPLAPTRSTSWAGASIRKGFGVIFRRTIPRFRHRTSLPRCRADSRGHAN